MSKQPERIELSDRVEYRLNGKLHREDGPALEFAIGSKVWYVDEKLHREGGPAVERASGSNEWYVDGKLHREDGPAVERANGTKEWWVDGKRHRLDGPAVEWVFGVKNYWIDGKLYSEKDFEKKRQEIYKSWLLTNYAMLQRGTYHPDVSRRLLGFVTGKM